MDKDYIKIFSGNFLISNRIKAELIEIGITPVIKDESESGRLAGFPSAMQGVQEIYVQSEEVEKAKSVVDRISAITDSE
ncbi:putative signal transducing protein [Arenibacter latericius]|uniref:putative signal transducing protein n=1 Tax=Arenibacter latericius TaxID=86104 RepID=UPI0004068ED9|nr:DUF2007 domain-containing protein [Arenibacter latericius]MDX1365639.1 DUF2007 domain-containing protein [Arenibacter latericius]